MGISPAISVILFLIGALLPVAALLAGLAAVSALLEWMQYGQGIIFADVELFVLLALVGGVLGFLLILAAKRARR